MSRQLFAALGLAACLVLVVAGCGSSSTPSSSSSSAGSATTTEGSGNESAQTYGAAAVGAEKAEIVVAAHSLFAAMASSDYAKVCAAITASNRQHLQTLLKAKGGKGGCAAILKTLIPSSEAPGARKAASAAPSSVRTKGDTAYVLFTPRGAKPSYVAMRKEDGAWKAITLTPPGTSSGP